MQSQEQKRSNAHQLNSVFQTLTQQHVQLQDTCRSMQHMQHENAQCLQQEQAQVSSLREEVACMQQQKLHAEAERACLANRMQQMEQDRKADKMAFEAAQVRAMHRLHWTAVRVVKEKRSGP